MISAGPDIGYEKTAEPAYHPRRNLDPRMQVLDGKVEVATIDPVVQRPDDLHAAVRRPGQVP
jgi:hypothetical protein